MSPPPQSPHVATLDVSSTAPEPPHSTATVDGASTPADDSVGVDGGDRDSLAVPSAKPRLAMVALSPPSSMAASMMVAAVTSTSSAPSADDRPAKGHSPPQQQQQHKKTPIDLHSLPPRAQLDQVSVGGGRGDTVSTPDSPSGDISGRQDYDFQLGVKPLSPSLIPLQESRPSMAGESGNTGVDSLSAEKHRSRSTFATESANYNHSEGAANNNPANPGEVGTAGVDVVRPAVDAAAADKEDSGSRRSNASSFFSARTWSLRKRQSNLNAGGPTNGSTAAASIGGGDEPKRTDSRARRRLRERNANSGDFEDAGGGGGKVVVTMGTKIAEGHDNYILMYDMLTGIRIAVSRCVAKPHRELVPADFRARHKLTFDIMGNELTPSSRYDFKFKDYAPWVFRRIREHFKIEAADYLISLTGKYVLSELGSPGKSGSFFYFSQDYRFIIKTISRTEFEFLLKILTRYYEHIRKNPNSLLSRYYGLHRVKLPRGRKIHFVVMGNVFPPNKDIHETFDLKGSTIGREVSAEEIKNKPRAVMKDLNWTSMQRWLKLGPEKSKILLEQMETDVKMLMGLNIMDYSLLLGIHYLKRGNSENIRDQSLSVFEPNPDEMARQPVSNVPGSKLSTLRKVIAHSDPVQLGPSSNKLPEQTPAERKGCVFYQDEGGFQATDEKNAPMAELYYLGIIDILTPYNIVKKVEHAWKALSHDETQISAVNPSWYGQRFLEFMKSKVILSSAANSVSSGQHLAIPESVAEETLSKEEGVELSGIQLEVFSANTKGVPVVSAGVQDSVTAVT